MPDSDPSWVTPQWSRAGSLAEFKFVALGTPKPKARPRTVRNVHTGFVQTYTPDATVSWEQAIAWQAKQALAWMEVNHPGEVGTYLPFSQRLMCDMQFNMARPKSLPKKVLYPRSGGDIDNLAKSVLDALQNVNVIADDKTVTDISVTKRFATVEHPEGVEITLTGWL